MTKKGIGKRSDTSWLVTVRSKTNVTKTKLREGKLRKISKGVRQK